MEKSNIAVFIGRFQPFHNGHEFAVREALKRFDRLIIVIGDTGTAPAPKNPFSIWEREFMIREVFDDEPELNDRIWIMNATDHASHTEWEASVVQKVEREIEQFNDEWDYPNSPIRLIDKKQIFLIGHDKDASSFYLKMFPEWNKSPTGLILDQWGNPEVIDATMIRHFIYSGGTAYLGSTLHPKVRAFIGEMVNNEKQRFADLAAWVENIKKYRKPYEQLPFPPIFVTVDAMVVSGSKVLMIRRKHNPGRGLLALPGGFLDQVETIEDGAIRELKEETTIKLQDDTLRRCIRHVEVFDRAGGVTADDRGRIITHAHLIVLDPTKEPPKVVASDDAEWAGWINIHDINPRETFSDHWNIVQRLRRFL